VIKKEEPKVEKQNEHVVNNKKEENTFNEELEKGKKLKELFPILSLERLIDIIWKNPNVSYDELIDICFSLSTA